MSLPGAPIGTKNNNIQKHPSLKAGCFLTGVAVNSSEIETGDIFSHAREKLYQL